MPQFTITLKNDGTNEITTIKRDFADIDEAKEVAVEFMDQVRLRERAVTIRFSIKDESGQALCLGVQSRPPLGVRTIIGNLSLAKDPLFKDLI